MNDALSDQAILRQLTDVFRQVFDDDTIVARMDMTAADVKKWDSLSHVDMIVLLEETFGIKIPTREVARLRNVGDLVRCVQARKA